MNELSDTEDKIGQLNQFIITIAISYNDGANDE